MDEVSRNTINSGDRSLYSTSNETTPLQKEKVQDEGFKFIVTIFTVVTVILTVGLGVSISQHTNEVEFRTSVVSDHPICTNVGKELFKNGGNAVDVAVAVTICLGVVFPHLTGIGGNGLVQVYNQRSETPLICLDSWTPGGLPKLLLALSKVHDRFGKKSWKYIIEPSISIANDGFLLTESFLQAKEHLKPNASELLKQLFSFLKVGMNVTFPQLAGSLRIIKDEGSDALYKGKLSVNLKKWLGADLQNNLNLNEGECLEYYIDGFRLVSSGKGSGGPFIIDTLINANLTTNSSIHHFIKYFEGKEESLWPNPSGVGVSAVDDQDIYVSIVSGLGPILGTQYLTSDGYIIGSKLALPGAEKLGSIGSTFIAAETSTRCKKRIITGGTDARNLLQVIPGLVWSDIDIQTTIEAARVRFGGDGFLSEVNHAPSLPIKLPPAPFPYPVINVIHKFADTITPYEDSRAAI